MINIPQPGTYSFAFTYIQVEAWPNVRGATVTAVLRHGDDVEVLTPGGVVANNNGTRFETTVEIAEAGEYILEFGQTSTDTKNTLLDNVELVYTHVADITVKSGTGIDMDLNENETTATRYPIVLDGGTLRRQGNSYLDDLLLTDDSTITVTRSGSIGRPGGARASFDLGGCVLAVDVENERFLRIYNCLIANGTIRTTGGTIRFGSTERGTIAATGVSLEANSPIDMIQDVDLQDYTANYVGTSNGGTAALNIYGTFRPIGAGYYGCTMQGGSTIRLDGWSGAVPLSGVKVADCESDATINISLAPDAATTRSWARGRRYLLEWSSAPDNVSFELDDSSKKKFRLVPDADGLRLAFPPGFTAIVK